ncbi:MAG: hypothetical protein IPJ65_22940 [Archangiaceae bacterium]|nr:hypothetical protein [Archangiaceae bacterium]
MSLLTTFCQHWRGTVPDDANALERALAAALDTAHAAHPDLAVDPLRFVAHVAARLPAEGDPVASLATLALTDLYLACAALDRDGRALTRLEQLCAEAAAMNPVDPSGPFRDELKQELMIALLVRPGTAGKLEGYRGLGRLGGWLRAVACGLALNLRARKQPAAPGDDHLGAELDVLIDWESPEVRLLQLQAGTGFKQAFHAALAQLPPKELNLLRLRCVDGVSDAGIAALYRVHRVTVVRWFQDLKTALLERTRRELAARSGLDVDSLVRAVDGELDASLNRFFHVESS